MKNPVKIMLPLLVAGFSAYASVDCTVSGRLLHRRSRKPGAFTTLFVTQGDQVISYQRCVTDKRGAFVLHFNIGSYGDAGALTDTTQWLRFYAVPKPGDTVLLQQSSFDFPASFKKADDQKFTTVFYLPE